MRHIFGEEVGETTETRIHAILPPSSTSPPPRYDTNLGESVIASLHKEWAAGIASTAIVAAAPVASAKHDCAQLSHTYVLTQFISTWRLISCIAHSMNGWQERRTIDIHVTAVCRLTLGIRDKGQVHGEKHGRWRAVLLDSAPSNCGR